MLTKDQAKEYWYEKQEDARKTMRLHKCNSALLIDVRLKYSLMVCVPIWNLVLDWTGL